MVVGGPVNSIAVVVLFTMFLLREIEGSLATKGHVTFDDAEQTISWRLPASKTDPTAMGCTRTWGCTCFTPSAPAQECPYHTMKHHVYLTEQHFGSEATDPDFPLFPTVEGKTVEGQAIVNLVDELAKRCGEPLVNDAGQRRYGKHSFRSTGAVYLSGLGIELLKIQMLARWASAIITHYTRLAPLRSITNDFKRAVLAAEEKNKTSKGTKQSRPISRMLPSRPKSIRRKSSTS